MKNLGVFYFIFILLLSMAPCADEKECSSPAQNAITKVSHGKNAGSQENCSPICLCACCGQHIVINFASVPEVKIPIVALAKTPPNYRFSLSQRTVSIWQPPKIA